MDYQNLAYALSQVIHNFGAVAVTAGAVAGLWLLPQQPLQARATAWLVMLAWLIQIASGVGFGAISFYYYGRFPDLSGIATTALVIKVASAGLGFILATLYLLRAGSWPDATHRRIWQTLTGLGVTALTAAAFLRWYS